MYGQYGPKQRGAHPTLLWRTSEIVQVAHNLTLSTFHGTSFSRCCHCIPGLHHTHVRETRLPGRVHNVSKACICVQACFVLCWTFSELIVQTVCDRSEYRARSTNPTKSAYVVIGILVATAGCCRVQGPICEVFAHDQGDLGERHCWFGR